MFHINEFINNNDDKIEEIQSTNLIENHFLINPIVKLTDFGLIKKEKYNKQAYPDLTRPPENILELPVNDKSDLWALGFSIYELINKNELIKFNYDSIYNDDLYRIKSFYEYFYEEHADILNIIKKSNKKDYFIKDDVLLFFKKINKVKWNNDDIRYKNLIKINPDNRYI